MALTRTESEDAVRVLTRHVGDTTRLTAAALRILLHDCVREIRTRLSDEQTGAPELYLVNTGSISEASRALTFTPASSAVLERHYRVDKLIDDVWIQVPRANPAAVNHHVQPLHWRKEGTSILLGPDWADVTGTYRVLYYIVHPTLSADADPWLIPDALTPMLKYKTASLVCIADRLFQDADFFEKKAESVWEAAIPALRDQHGVHDQHAGFVDIVGY